MAYYAFIQNDKLVGRGQCRILNDDIITLEISEEMYASMESDIDRYVYRNGSIMLDENNPDRIARLSAEVKVVRNEMLDGTDKYMTIDFPVTDDEREQIKAYRQYLRDYPTIENWWTKNPLTLDEWKKEQ